MVSKIQESSNEITLLDKEYDAEILGDAERDLYECFDELPDNIERDQHGFEKGTYKVIVTFIPED